MDPDVPGPLSPDDEHNPTGPAEDEEKYLDGVDYPATREEVASTAQGKGAPQELVDRIRELDKESFSSTEDVLASM